jgi:hypothetical protein
MVSASMIGLVLGSICSAGCTEFEPPPPVHVPAAYLPAPGYCRVWYAGRDAAEQPEPGPCRIVRLQVPNGATLIVGTPRITALR